MILKIPGYSSMIHSSTWAIRTPIRPITTCSSASNTKTRANYPPICSSSRASANSSIQNTAYSLTLASSPNRMRSIRCGLTCRKTHAVEEFAAIWVCNSKIHPISLDTETMAMTLNKLPASPVPWIPFSQSKEPSSSSITSHICWINRFNLSSATSTCFQERFQVTAGKPSKAWPTNRKKRNTTKAHNPKDTHTKIRWVLRRNKKKLLWSDTLKLLYLKNSTSLCRIPTCIWPKIV